MFKVTFQAFSSLKHWIIQSTLLWSIKTPIVVSKHVDLAGLVCRVSQLFGHQKLWAKGDLIVSKSCLWIIYQSVLLQGPLINTTVQCPTTMEHLQLHLQLLYPIIPSPNPFSCRKSGPRNTARWSWSMRTWQTHQSASKDMAPVRFPLLMR